MYLLYLDASGTVADPNENYIVLAGVAIFERQVYYASRALDDLAQTIDPHNADDIEFHGSVMFNGRKEWKRHEVDVRRSLIKQGLSVLAQTHETTRLFGTAVHKAARSPRDPLEYAFEQVCNRFDRYLARLYRQNNRQKGLIIFDKSTYEGRLQSLAKDFRTIGHSWGVTRDINEVPLFVDSKATRLIQLADLVSYATYRRFEKSDPQFFDVIQNRFDSEGGVVHGFHHFKPRRDDDCDCPACQQDSGNAG